jgi:hypothetical protein
VAQERVGEIEASLYVLRVEGDVLLVVFPCGLDVPFVERQVGQGARDLLFDRDALRLGERLVVRGARLVRLGLRPVQVSPSAICTPGSSGFFSAAFS